MGRNRLLKKFGIGIGTKIEFFREAGTNIGIGTQIFRDTDIGIGSSDAQNRRKFRVFGIGIGIFFLIKLNRRITPKNSQLMLYYNFNKI